MVDEIVSYAALESVAFGNPKMGWFAALNTSQRSIAPTRSVALMVFVSDRSVSLRRGPTMLFRPSLP